MILGVQEMRKLEKVFTITLFISLSFIIVTMADVPTKWQDDGIPLRQGFHIEWQRAGAMDNDGNVCYVWSDTRYGDRDVFAQKFSSDGDAIWEDNGIVVVQAYSRQEDPDVMADEDGSFFISWVDYRVDTLGDVYVQKIDTDGNQLWAEEGVPLATNYNVEQKTLHTMPDGLGGTIVLWHDRRSGDEGDLYAQHVDSSGVIDPLWEVDGNVVAQSAADQGGAGHQTVDVDGAGGIIVAWSDNRDAGNNDIYAQRISRDGELMWAGGDVGGLAICTAEEYQLAVKLAPDGSGGAFLVWYDKRNIETTREDLYMQHLDHEGQTLWADNGIPLSTAAWKQEGARIVHDGTGNAIVGWADFRNHPYGLLSDIYAQKVSPDGNLLWNPDGILICDADEDQNGMRINSDGAGGAVVAWVDDRNGAYPLSDIYTQKINSGGTVAWTANGVIVSNAEYMQTDPLVRVDSNGLAYIAWSDSRLGSAGIFYQILHPAGTPNLTPNGEVVVFGIDGNAQNPAITKLNSPHSKYMVVWEDLNYVYVGGFIYHQVFGLEGEGRQEFNGQPIAIEYNKLDSLANGQKDPALIPDAYNGAIVCWEDYRAANLGIPQIYVQRVKITGEILWDSSGVRIMPTDVNQENPQICTDTEGGALIAWEGYSPDLNVKAHIARITPNGDVPWFVEITDGVNDEYVRGIIPDGEGGAVVYWKSGSFMWGFDLFAARIDGDGNVLWFVPVCEAAEDESYFKGMILSDGNLLFNWQDYRFADDHNLYAQKIDISNGDPLWTMNGISICSETGDQQPNDMKEDSQGNVYILWQDSRETYSNNDIYLQKIDSVTGDPLFLASGIPVSVHSSGDQWHGKILVDENDGVQVAWEDMRSTLGSDIYASHLDANGDLVEGWIDNGDAVCTYFNRQISPLIVDDYFDGVVAVWEDGRSSGKSEILNLYMQHWNPDELSVSNDENLLPDKSELQQNYPNPFNNETVIDFALRKAGRVKLSVYNSLGQEVVILADKDMTLGAKQITWDGRNGSNEFVSTGLYFYRLEFDGEMKVMKMIMVK